ncbi:hypothetical protein SUDANB6_05786 [Streptomyces sp. enrichment culture]
MSGLHAVHAPLWDRAKRLVGVPGAPTHFPSEQLHVGEAPDAVAANVDIAFFTESDPAALAGQAVGGLLARTRADEADARPHTPDGIPAAAAATLTAPAELSADEVEDAVWGHHMRSVTSGGLGVGRPAASPVALPRDARVRTPEDVVVRQRPGGVPGRPHTAVAGIAPPGRNRRNRSSVTTSSGQPPAKCGGMRRLPSAHRPPGPWFRDVSGSPCTSRRPRAAASGSGSRTCAAARSRGRDAAGGYRTPRRPLPAATVPPRLRPPPPRRTGSGPAPQVSPHCAGPSRPRT